MTNNLCAAVVCLLLAGCSVMGESSHKAINGVRLSPIRFRSKPGKQSLIKAVERDPFPRANHVDPRVDLQI